MTSASPTRLRAIARDAAVVLIVSYLLGYWHEELPRAAALLLAFVALPLLGGALVWRVHGAISELLTEHRELLRTREQLHELATRDSLTRLLNRGTILERLTQELERARRHAHPIAVILADIDHFKRVNDTYGHQAGDQVLASVSSRIMAAIRPYDLAGRYGGEELIVVLEGVDECGAMQCAERLRDVIAREPFDLTDGEVAVTCSFGVVASADATSVVADDLIRYADAALYAAKRNGRNRVEAHRHSPVHTSISPLPGSPASPQNRR
jgi:diguanylate cyclase (GGDEF)-like protein